MQMQEFNKLVNDANKIIMGLHKEKETLIEDINYTNKLVDQK
jgi:hypothetical protein